MFGPQNGYEGFPSRSNVNIEDLMSLNSLNQNDYSNKKPAMQGDSRSLRTDDIPGAKPRSGARMAQVEQVYSGLSLPSYGKNSSQPNSRLPPRPDNIQSDNYLKNAANFFGTTPPGSPRALPSQYKPQPRPQIFDYPAPSDPTFTNKAAANFYGATPPQSRVPNQIPPKAAANFYGATPPGSRAPNVYYDPNQYSNQYSNPPPNPPSNYGSPPGLPPKAVANFYGATPPQSRSVYPNPELNYANPPNNYGSSPGLPPKAAANFYGVTPPQSRSVDPNPLNPDQNYRIENYQRNPVAYTPIPAPIPPKEYANFYGATPPMSRANQGVNPSSGQIPPKQLANFYGATPPPSGVNVYKSNQGYEGNAYMAPSNVPARDLANFYGATPQVSGQQRTNAPDFNVNAAKFFGHDGISPEFQYAADIVNKAPGSYQALPKPYTPIPTRSDRPAHHLVDTAKRIFN